VVTEDGLPDTPDEERTEVLKRLQVKMSTEEICAELLLPFSRVMELKRDLAGSYPFY
jgi:hypothetical protein